MAEKEERIRVLVSKNPCEKCDIKPCTRKCMFGLLFEKAPGITRQEAIERMAKAICKFEMMTARHICEECQEDCTDHLEMEVVDKAEAALNALLED